MKTLHKFIYEHGEDNEPDTIVTYTTTSETLTDILLDFEDHLRGCGFIIKGHIDIIEDGSNDKNDTDTNYFI